MYGLLSFMYEAIELDIVIRDYKRKLCICVWKGKKFSIVVGLCNSYK